jgi:glyoxylase-like metal-dependent hydrolase (beta-lactamase superfamily II)
MYRRIVDGESIAINGRNWIVRVGRGHSPEHACLHCPELGVLISGDQILPKITPNVSVWYSEPFAEPLSLFLASIASFRSLPHHTLVLPSHKLPFRGLHARLDELERHHAARLADAYSACEAKPHTANEILRVLFRRDLDSHQTSFALGESLAHLHYLVAEGRLVRETGTDGRIRFARA